MHVTVIREREDKLKRHVWEFFYMDNRHSLVCRSYCIEARHSLRHKYRAVAEFNPYRRQDVNMVKPEIPPDVATEARFSLASELSTWLPSGAGLR
jgi:hypothetical protein